MFAYIFSYLWLMKNLFNPSRIVRYFLIIQPCTLKYSHEFLLIVSFYVRFLRDFLFEALSRRNLTKGRVGSLGSVYALGHSSFFKKYERKNLEFFTWSWENDFGNLCPSLIEKIGFPFKKNIPYFQEPKYIFCSKFFSIKIGKTEFSFLINGSDN